MNSQVIAQGMDILLKRGLFASEESLLLSAYRSLLTLNPELKTELALSLYEREEISLGRAAEIGGISREQFKEILASRGIERRIAERAPEQIDFMARFDRYQIEGRYPDMLYPAPDIETTQQELEKAGEMLKWLNTQF